MEGLGLWTVQGLSNGNYVVISPSSSVCGMGTCGAAIWGDGSTGTHGEVSLANALVGAEAPSAVGIGGVLPLANGDALVISPYASANGQARLGAVTRIDGEKGLVGVISSANSLVGTRPFDRVGFGGVEVLKDGNYVVVSPEWSSEQGQSVGAVTWFAADAPTQGEISESNSLVGDTAGDRVGGAGIAALSNGHFAVASPDWDHGDAVDAGAVTWANGLSGSNGHVSASNSMVGAPGHRVGAGGITSLTDGNYVISSPAWHTPGTMFVGAVTWVSGVGTISGTVSASNSLTGAVSNDSVGFVYALHDGSYVVASALWDNGTATNAGAITWVPGGQPFGGVVSTTNSMTGTSELDFLGGGGVVLLGNGMYAVLSPSWNNGSSSLAGAVTILQAGVQLNGSIGPLNSLVGTRLQDRVGSDGMMPVGNGEYVIGNPHWDNKKIGDAGAYLFGRGLLAGPLDETTSVFGTEPYGGWNQGGAGNVYTYDEPRRRMIVGRYLSNMVSILSLTPDTLLHGSFEVRPSCPEVSWGCL